MIPVPKISPNTAQMILPFEALVGYLYLQAQHDRLLELIRDGLEKIGELS